MNSFSPRFEILPVDFDFFSHRPLDGSMEEKTIRKLPFLSESLLLQKEPDMRTWSTREGVKLFFSEVFSSAEQDIP